MALEVELVARKPQRAQIRAFAEDSLTAVDAPLAHHLHRLHGIVEALRP